MNYEPMRETTADLSGSETVHKSTELQTTNDGQTKASNRTRRVTAVLPGGRCVTLACQEPDLEVFIQTLDELATKARKVRPRGIELSTFIRILKDEARV